LEIYHKIINFFSLGSYFCSMTDDFQEEEGFDDDTDYLQKLDDLVPSLKAGDYLLTVEGDSMIDAGLEAGQYVVLRPGIKPENGDICAVWIEGEGGTLKRVYAGKDNVLLVPENSRYQPREYPAEQVRIQGVLVAALGIRTFR
jgi:repressor LexA